METYYFLWVAVRKVLAEAPNVMLDLFKVLIVPVGKRELIVTHDILKRFSGASVRADQKTQFLKELLDGANPVPPSFFPSCCPWLVSNSSNPRAGYDYCSSQSSETHL